MILTEQIKAKMINPIKKRILILATKQVGSATEINYNNAIFTKRINFKTSGLPPKHRGPRFTGGPVYSLMLLSYLRPEHFSHIVQSEFQQLRLARLARLGVPPQRHVVLGKELIGVQRRPGARSHLLRRYAQHPVRELPRRFQPFPRVESLLHRLDAHPGLDQLISGDVPARNDPESLD